MAAGFSQSMTSARRERPVTRWLRPLGVGTIVAVIVLSAHERPSPSLHGRGLAVTIALVVLVAGIALVMRHPSGRRMATLTPVAMIVASSALIWMQRGGPAVAGLFVAVSYGALRLPQNRSGAVFALAVLMFAAAAVHGQRSAGLLVSAELGVAAFYVLASFARRVQEAHEQTARLLAELEASRRAQEDAAVLRERSRIAREIHDVLAHSLSGLVLQLEGARMLVGTPNANGQLPAALDRAHHLARAGLDEARRAIGALRDDDLPGPDRLQQLVADFRGDTQIEAALEVTGEPRRLDPQTSLTLFRVAQEALTNSRTHARPRRVEVQLAYESQATRLVVEDHGEPVVAASAPDGRAREAATVRRPPTGAGQARKGARPGYGLTGMRERAELLGGSLQAAPTGDGFRVELRIPT